MKDSTQVYIRRLIAFLEADDYITQTSHGDFSVLTLTRRSAEILMDKKTITIRLPKKKPKSETVTKIGRDEVTTFDKELFGRLRDMEIRRVCLHISFLQTLHCVICV